MPSLCVVVPTFNEGGNVEALVSRLAVALAGRDAEVLFVDDSTDDTPQVIAEVSRRSGLPVRLLHRDVPTGGLAGAVRDGIATARSDTVLVMDGDLQHPPELTGLLVDTLEREGADLVVASRYCGVGDASGLTSGFRRVVSGSSNLLAQACFPRRVGSVCTDPMTGFFVVRRSAVDLQRLRPRGFKILLEILARHDLRVSEVPFAFGERGAGASKASWRNGLSFLHQLLALRMGRMSRFAAVGVLGTVVNLGVMWLLVHLTSVHYVAAAAVAAELSILHNFVMQERFVFRDLRRGHWLSRLGTTLAFNNLEALARVPLLIVLVELVGLRPVIGQALLLGIAFVGRFLFTSRIVYRPRRRATAAVPDVPAVESEAA